MGRKNNSEQAQEENDVLLSEESTVIAEDDSNTLAAENEQLKNENAALKEQVAALLATPDAEEKKDGVGEKFKFEKKTYEILVPRMRIPVLGQRSALQVLDDAKAQEWLVKNKSGFIKELQ